MLVVCELLKNTQRCKVLYLHKLLLGNNWIHKNKFFVFWDVDYIIDYVAIDGVLANEIDIFMWNGVDQSGSH